MAVPDDPRTHEKVLKERLKVGVMSTELKDYAQNVLVRGLRTSRSVSWEKFDAQAQGLPNTFTWAADPDVGNKKLLRTVAEVTAELQPAPTTGSVKDGPLARLNGDMTNDLDLWQLVRNIGSEGTRLRRRLYTDRQIAHPHIGAWVSAKKPWCPPLSNPVGNWQNVYQILVLGMFDSHYMPQHAFLRHALKPIIEQAWHATSRKAFSKVLFAPERFNIRELPKGGSPLQWHIDQSAIAPACGADPQEEAEKMGGFLKDPAWKDEEEDDLPLADRVKLLQKQMSEQN